MPGEPVSLPLRAVDPLLVGGENRAEPGLQPCVGLSRLALARTAVKPQKAATIAAREQKEVGDELELEATTAAPFIFENVQAFPSRADTSFE